MMPVDGLFVFPGDWIIEMGIRDYDPKCALLVIQRRKYGLMQGTRIEWLPIGETPVVKKGLFGYCAGKNRMELCKGTYRIGGDNYACKSEMGGTFKYYGELDRIWLVEGKFQEGERTWDGYSTSFFFLFFRGVPLFQSHPVWRM